LELGLPSDWKRVENWIYNSTEPAYLKEIDVPTFKKKNTEIPTVSNYDSPPNSSFWNIFPKKSIPFAAESNVKSDVLLTELELKKEFLTTAQMVRGLKTADFVKNGADSCQAIELPSCMQKNAKNAIIYGDAVTDTVATWIKEGFVAGPFNSPPLDKFRTNCLMAIPQGSKVRPVLNGSLPAECSLNSNVDPHKVEKVEMCSARCFSYSVIDAGDSCYMAKMDMQNAYKNVPCKPNDYRLQGFHWLGKYFIETRQIFGAKTAVCNFDILGNTVLELTLTECSINRSLVHRQLDDVPIVVPAQKKSWCNEFVEKYKIFCSKIGISLAEDDSAMEKAFSCTQCGKVLGVNFNTVGLVWSYPEDKKLKLLNEISMFLRRKEVGLLQMQMLMGRINDIGIMIPFLKCFKNPLNEMLAWLHLNPEKKIVPNDQCRKDILVWAGFVMDKNIWCPISPRPSYHPISCYSFTSDAAGFNEHSDSNSEVGFGVIGFNPDGEICMANQTFWPKELRSKLDKKGARFGSKTILLEIIGLLAPFMLMPEKICNSHIILNVDNIGCYFGWVNKSVKNDVCASIVIRAIVLISSYLSIQVHVKHLPRNSNWEASLCDRLSRSVTTSSNDRRLLRSYDKCKIPDVVLNWLKDPVENWNVSYEFLDIVQKMMN
jgi:hypothetical protein